MDYRSQGLAEHRSPEHEGKVLESPQGLCHGFRQQVCRNAKGLALVFLSIPVNAVSMASLNKISTRAGAET